MTGLFGLTSITADVFGGAVYVLTSISIGLFDSSDSAVMSLFAEWRLITCFVEFKAEEESSSMLSARREFFCASANDALLLVLLPLMLLLFMLLVLLLLLVMLFLLLLLLLLLLLMPFCCAGFSVVLLPDIFCVEIFLVVLSPIFSDVFCASAFCDVPTFALSWFIAGFLLS